MFRHAVKYFFFIIFIIISQKNVISADEMQIYNATTPSIEVDETIQLLEKMEIKFKNLIKSATRLSLPYLMRIFTETKLSSPCVKSGLKFLRDLVKLKGWALKMIDSFGKPSSGLLTGTLWMQGDYDQCLNIIDKENERLSLKSKLKIIKGKYCALMIKLPGIQRKENAGHHNRTQKSFIVRYISDGLHFGSQDIRIDVCMPSTCRQEDLQSIANWFFKDLLSTRIEFCKTKDDKTEYSLAQIISLILFSFIFIWVIMATILEKKLRVNQNMDNIGIVLKCFIAASSYNAFQHIFSVNFDKRTKSFCGIKVILISIIVYGHVLCYIMAVPTITAKSSNIFEMTDDIPVEIASSSFSMLDTYFFISGFLICYYRRKNDQNSKLQYFIFLLKRYIRLTLPIMFILAFVIVLPLLGDGPHWHNIFMEGKLVEEIWWKFLFHIYNFCEITIPFLSHLWFLHVMMQLSILTIPILFIQDRWPKLGTILLSILIIAGFVFNAVNLWIDQSFIIFGVSLDVDKLERFFTNNYNKPYYFHLSSYCFGLLIGYILEDRRKIKFRKITRIFLWIISLILMGLVTFGTHDYKQEISPNKYVIFVYQALAASAWIFAMAWVCVTCCTGNAVIINKFLSLNIFVVMDRLTIWVYVLHPFILHYIIGNLRNSQSMMNINMWMIYSLVMMLCLLASFLIIIFIESPINTLVKLFITTSTDKKIVQEKQSTKF